MRGTVLSVHIAPAGRAPIVSVGEIQAIAGVGLEGDRYFRKTGSFSKTPGSGREVTLIEMEAVEALKREYQIAIDAAQARRNIVTQGIALNHLIDRQFAVGEVVLRGTRLCDPCSHLEKLTIKGVMRGLIHRGGLRADVVRGGIIRVGNVVSSG
ncbi:MAG TPA: MOSC domain-containing protein [Candidatus Polarisedimenticolaceae bacterium]|nr:MOSC domain-containing protein [Candidatus Polarisedimenticolaceae bacterium]